VSRRVSTAAEASQRFCKVESLLDRTLADLTGQGHSAPCSTCAQTLSEIVRELEPFAALFHETAKQMPAQTTFNKEEVAALIPRLNAFLSGIARSNRLLATGSEFYRGWCAAGSTPVLPISGYETVGWLQGPALLALEG
jgi:hypothetical protein